MNIAINGFGRIGRTLLRRLLMDENSREKINIVAINIGPSQLEHTPHLFAHDTVMGRYAGNVYIKNNRLHIESLAIRTRSTIGMIPGNAYVSGTRLHIDTIKIDILQECDPKKLPWKSLGVDWVAECSGCFTSREKAAWHLEAGAKKVLISAPGKNEDITILPGINDNDYDASGHDIISLGSCTTNAFAPMVSIALNDLGFTSGIMTTIHAYTNNQRVLDATHKDARRARAAACNIIPTSTGASRVITKVFPQLEGKLQAAAMRVPVPIGSLIDFSFTSKKSLDVATINNAFKLAADTTFSPILEYTDQPLVSSDIAGNPASCIFDSALTQASGNLGKIFGWYDNEVGYSERMKDFFLHNC
jgi:glyceraldehyde 3-phosphate dehydrogenase